MATLHKALERAATIAVIGLGREGKSFLRYSEQLSGGRKYLVIDDNALSSQDLGEVRGLDVELVSGKSAAHSDALKGCDFIFRSPGVSIHQHPVLQSVEDTPVATSVNLWCERYPEARKIMVTGTKGKSTTSALLHHVLTEMGFNTALGGNIGVPLLDIEPGADFSVLELSSYQIADLSHAPDCAVLINLYPEHIDWHGSIERYYGDKCRLITELRPRLAVVNGADETVQQYISGAMVSGRFGMADGYHASADCIYGAGQDLDIHPRLRGFHNNMNICAVLEILRQYELIEFGAPMPSRLLDAFASFRPLAHRLEEVGERDGRLYVNDSISTTPESVLAALDVYKDRPVTLLLGGYERGQDYTRVLDKLGELPQDALLMLPGNGLRIADAARQVFGSEPARYVVCDSLEEAMEHAERLTPAGGVVLLSPGAPSYGSFRNFEERGERFRQLSGAVPLSRKAG